MKKSTLNRTAVLFVAALLATGFHVSAADKKAAAGAKKAVVTDSKGDTYKVLPDQSQVKWVGKKVTGSHNGTISLKGGEISTAGGIVTGGTFVVDMASIQNADITDAESNGKLVGHLKSDDFFGAAAHPTATFTITKVTMSGGAKAGEPNYKLEGDLTIKGATHPASFDAVIAISGDTLTATAKQIKVDRTLYDIRYGSKKFFASIGDKAIFDDFFIDVMLVAKK